MKKLFLITGASSLTYLISASVYIFLGQSKTMTYTDAVGISGILFIITFLLLRYLAKRK